MIALWSILCFLIPLALAVASRLYALAFVLAGVIVFSFWNHRSPTKISRVLDATFAWILMIAHLILCVLGGFSFPYFMIVLTLIPIALYFFFKKSRGGYDMRHGLWHLFAAAISVFSQLTFLASR